MPDPISAGRRERIHAKIDEFLAGRLIVKLDKLAPEDPKRQELITQHQRPAWLENAARRVQQIQLVTHTLKPIHPDARGTNLYIDPGVMAPRDEVGSHVLSPQFSADVVGNAAALDVYKFLKLEIDGRSLLDWLHDEDGEAMAALSDDVAEARAWRDAFVSVLAQRGGELSTHPLSKQVFWLAGNDATLDEQYHLLAPLYASSLAHAVFPVIQEDRYGEKNKAARQARNARRWHDGAVREYPGLAVQKLGGTKPQNVSQLNSERGGVNYLLGALPPVWQAQELRPPWKMESIFEGVYARQAGVREVIAALLRFLEQDPPRNEATRKRVSRYVDKLIDELVGLAVRYHERLEPGWSRDARCRLVHVEALWLDPLRATLRDETEFAREWMALDWPVAIGSRFARWFNAQLRTRISGVGDDEHRNWKRELLGDERDGGWSAFLNTLRRELDVQLRVVAESKA
ncbi:CRISPR-associated protein Csy1 [Pigmentiphaga humi]|uniref:CRISPR-associated protein Csy1 n=1 Tax=Pigmentiphaga humi TaxID=2478468 RepID=A0A3P4AVA1_9BURK|nr:type I-F CRISPR-associated protein Csy1 [Pigmentiphaga humi]VCU67959.1 CRISPR-associated protein Csy1 [Pigmentiphaga humi]